MYQPETVDTSSDSLFQCLFIHYTTLHYTTLHYTTLHYTTLHYITLYYTTLHYTTLDNTMLLYTKYIHARKDAPHTSPNTRTHPNTLALIKLPNTFPSVT